MTDGEVNYNGPNYQLCVVHSVNLGGIGGVHRGGQDTLDISADLTELGRNPVAVVCSGIKSILDIGRTLEYLVSILPSGIP